MNECRGMLPFIDDITIACYSGSHFLIKITNLETL